MVAKIWEAHFDSIELTGKQGKWDESISIHNPPPQLPASHDGLSNEDFVTWVYSTVLGKPELIHSHRAMRNLQALNFGIIADPELD